MKIFISLIFILSASFFSDLKIHSVINMPADRIYADEFDNIYVISGNQFFKFNSEGEKKAVFDSHFNETVSYADVSNSMKIMLFFKDQNKILFLDNKLSPIGNAVLLENENIYGDVLICSSESGGFWLTDNSLMKLIKYNTEAKEEFRKDLFELNDTPEYLISNNNSLFIRTKNKTVFVFDNLGNFNYKMNKKIPADFVSSGNNLKYFNNKEQTFVSYNFETEDSIFIKLPDSLSVQNAIQSPHYLIFNDESKVYVSEMN